MIRHTVMWKTVDTYNTMNKLELLNEMKAQLLSLPDKIDEIITLEVDINTLTSPAHFDILLYSTFETLEDLNAYQIHPEHVKVGNFIKEIAIDRVVCDAEITTA